MNVWILPAFFFSRRYMIDIGFFLKNDDDASDLSALRVVVPYANPEATCLVTHMEAVPDSWLAVFGDTPPEPGIRTRSSLTVDHISGLKSHSVWSLTLDPAVKPRQDAYVRLRFGSYERPACIDAFGGWLGFGARVRLDLRLFDSRELSEFRWVAEDVQANSIPVSRSFVYLVAPHVSRPELFSPDFSYIRVLEDPLWRRYLARRPSLLGRRTRKMHVFAWKRQPEAEPDSPHGQPSPHRVFATLVGKTFASNLARVGRTGAAAVALVGGLMALSYPLLTSLKGGRFDRLGSAASSYEGWVQAVADLWWPALLIFIVLNAPGIVDRVGRIWQIAGKARKKVDEILYAINS